VILVGSVVGWCLACGGALEPLPEGPGPKLLAPTDAADLSELLEPIREEHGVPALSAAVIRGGAVVAIGAVGLDRTDRDTEATVDDLWHVGSDGKAMTATLMARLVERDVLSWDTTVGEVLEELGADSGWNGVTVEQLLTHTAGLPANPPKSWMLRLLVSSDSPRDQREQLLMDMLSHPPEWEPGTRFEYSNLGYVTAAAMAETLTNTAFEALIAAEVFEPLGVVDFGFGPPPPPSPAGHMGDAFTPVEPVPIADNPRALAPAGTMHFTLTSWAAFVGAHVAGVRGERTDFLPDEAWSELHRARLDEYAMGWGVAEPDWVGTRVFTHSGSNTMWYARAMGVPAWDTAYLVATNCGADACRDVAPATMRALVAAHGAPPATPEQPDASSPETR